MNYCKTCGVELDDELQQCPLCGRFVLADANAGEQSSLQTFPYNHQEMTPHEKQATWEIVSMILLSGIVTTILINLILSHRITWAEYPVAVCLAAFSYISVFAFSKRTLLLKLFWGCLFSVALMLLTDAIAGGIQWALLLGMPLLIIANVLVVVLILVIYHTRNKGFNIIAYSLIAAALYCVCIEGLVSMYRMSVIALHWGLIVVACAVPVAIVLLFIQYYYQRGQSLAKTFHL